MSAKCRVRYMINIHDDDDNQSFIPSSRVSVTHFLQQLHKFRFLFNVINSSADDYRCNCHSRDALKIMQNNTKHVTECHSCCYPTLHFIDSYIILCKTYHHQEQEDEDNVDKVETRMQQA